MAEGEEKPTYPGLVELIYWAKPAGEFNPQGLRMAKLSQPLVSKATNGASFRPITPEDIESTPVTNGAGYFSEREFALFSIGAEHVFVENGRRYTRTADQAKRVNLEALDIDGIVIGQRQCLAEDDGQIPIRRLIYQLAK